LYFGSIWLYRDKVVGVFVCVFVRRFTITVDGCSNGLAL
jgi:hypothetical protein